MTKLQKEVLKRRIVLLPEISGKRVKSAKTWGSEAIIIFDDDTFITITPVEAYDSGCDLEFCRYLDITSMRYLGLLTEEQWFAETRKQEISRKAFETERDKKEYERLKKKFEGK